MIYVAAEARLQLREASESEQLYRRLLEQYPNHPDQQLWRVRLRAALQMQKKHTEAVELLKPILGEIRDKRPAGGGRDPSRSERPLGRPV